MCDASRKVDNNNTDVIKDSERRCLDLLFFYRKYEKLMLA